MRNIEDFGGKIYERRTSIRKSSAPHHPSFLLSPLVSGSLVLGSPSPLEATWLLLSTSTLEVGRREDALSWQCCAECLAHASSFIICTMKAAVYRSFSGPIKIEDVPKPTAPSSGVVIQVMATGVCRSDWHGWKGHDSDIIDHGLPFTPGHEVSGWNVEVGSGVTKFKLGDRVAVPFILSCGQCSMCCKYNRPTVCEKQSSLDSLGMVVTQSIWLYQEPNGV